MNISLSCQWKNAPFRPITVYLNRCKNRSINNMAKSIPSFEFTNGISRKGKQFQIQIAGERIQIPAEALFNIEHER
jgi:hypothetical protein